MKEPRRVRFALSPVESVSRPLSDAEYEAVAVYRSHVEICQSCRRYANTNISYRCHRGTQLAENVVLRLVQHSDSHTYCNTAVHLVQVELPAGFSTVTSLLSFERRRRSSQRLRERRNALHQDECVSDRPRVEDEGSRVQYTVVYRCRKVYR